MLHQGPCPCSDKLDWCPRCGGRLGLAPHIGVAKARGAWWARDLARMGAGPLPPWPATYTDAVREGARQRVEDLSDHEVVIEGLARVCAEEAAKEWEELRRDGERLERVRTEG